MSGKYDAEVSDLLVKSTTLAIRGRSYKLFKKRPKLDVKKFSFCYRMVDVWNKLPDSVVSANTVHSFERRLDKYMNNQAIVYQYDAPLVLTGNTKI